MYAQSVISAFSANSVTSAMQRFAVPATVPQAGATAKSRPPGNQGSGAQRTVPMGLIGMRLDQAENALHAHGIAYRGLDGGTAGDATAVVREISPGGGETVPDGGVELYA
jgi:hypothetical protein